MQNYLPLAHGGETPWLQPRGREGRGDLRMLPAPSSAHGHRGDGAMGLGSPTVPQRSAQEVKLVQASQNQSGVGTKWVLARESEPSLPVSSSAGSEWIL